VLPIGGKTFTDLRFLCRGPITQDSIKSHLSAVMIKHSLYYCKIVIQYT